MSSMKALQELVLIVSRNKVKSISMLDKQSKKTSRIEEFYEAIKEGHLHTDQEAAQYLFPNKENRAAYRNLKARLKSKLINTLFFIDVKKPGYTDRQRAYYQCYKNLAAAKILLGKNARLACVDLCKNILRHAQRFEFSGICLEICRVLRLHYGAREGSLSKYQNFRALSESYQNICTWEDKAEELYTELTVFHVQSKCIRENTKQKAAEYVELLTAAVDEFGSYKLHLYHSLIKLILYSSDNNHAETIRVCNESISIFQEKPFQASTPLQIYYYHKLICYTQLRQFEEGRQTASACLQLTEQGSYNWFQFRELYLILCMYTQQYQNAYDLYLETTGHDRFSFLPAHVKEYWKVYEAYLYFLLNLGIIKGKDSFSKFRLGRFLNDTPQFSKDKRGMNIAILIIQILHWIQQGRYNRAIDSLEAIKKYCARYLHKEDTIRSYYFIKMLLCIPEASFHRRGVIRKARPFLEKLSTVPLAEVKQMHKIEILPYELLWDFMLNLLDSKFHRQRKR